MEILNLDETMEHCFSNMILRTRSMKVCADQQADLWRQAPEVFAGQKELPSGSLHVSCSDQFGRIELTELASKSSIRDISSNAPPESVHPLS